MHYKKKESHYDDKAPVPGHIHEHTRSMNFSTKEEYNDSMQRLTIRNKQLEDFCYIISHNLRTPVASLGKLCELLMVSGSLAEAMEYGEKVDKISNYLYDTLEGLILSLQSTQEPGEDHETIEMLSVLERIVDSMQCEIAETNAIISADFHQVASFRYPAKYLESIFMNLISNALKYQMPGEAPLMKVWSSVQNGWICLDFSDNGIGLDLERYKNDIFRFRRTFHKHSDSKGIGLFMIKTQVESLGGEISVTGGVNLGLHFHIKLQPINNKL